LGLAENVLAQAILELKSSNAYRLIERYKKPLYYSPDDGSPKFKGVFLDVESTGLFIPEDKIIELGMVIFEYGADGRIFRILEEFSEYQDPGKPIPPHIVKLTGITDLMVKNRQLDKQKVFQHLNTADMIIAHYANFDRACLEAHWPDIPVKPWACTMSQISWGEEGIESAKLEYLAYRYGFFYEGHRASTDCLAGVHLLSQVLPHSKERVLKTLLNASKKITFRVWALNAPFAKKELLKARQYRWSADGQGKHKAWFLELPEERLLEELTFLWEEIYAYAECLPVEEINAKNRFSKKATLKEHWIESLSQAEELLQ
jgi:DNA polymerase-3 subunit epsilon